MFSSLNIWLSFKDSTCTVLYTRINWEQSVIKKENTFLTWLSLTLKQVVKNRATFWKVFLKLNVLKKCDNTNHYHTLVFLNRWKDIRDSDDFWSWKLTWKTRFIYFLTTHLKFSEIQIKEKSSTRDFWSKIYSQLTFKTSPLNTEGFQPSQNIIERPWVYRSFFIIQIYFHALLFI